MLFPSTAFKIPKPKSSNMRGTAYSLLPPFKSTGVGRPAPGSSARLARAAELRASASNAAIKQQNAMDVAKSSGQITDREIMKTNKILNRRRRAAM
jgi:hypothetical protein